MQPYPHHVALKRKPIAWIRKNKKPTYMYVDPATLLPLGARASGAKSAQVRLIPKPKEELNPLNVHTTTTLFLLRLRANTIRTAYKRYGECKKNIKPEKFEWESPERDGEACERQENLLHCIEQHLPWIHVYGNQIRLSESIPNVWRRRIGVVVHVIGVGWNWTRQSLLNYYAAKMKQFVALKRISGRALKRRVIQTHQSIRRNSKWTLYVLTRSALQKT